VSVEKYFMSECSQQVKYFSTGENKFCISKWPCNALFIIISTNEIQNHVTFAEKGWIYYVTMIIFTCEDDSHVIFICEGIMLNSHEA